MEDEYKPIVQVMVAVRDWRRFVARYCQDKIC
jgi:hypothetical protein